jgi:hypothetical protein
MSTLTNVNDKIIAERALQGFAAVLFPVSAFATNFNSDAAKPGDAINVPLVNAITSTTFSYSANSGFPYEGTGGTMSGITITLDAQKINTVDLNDLQKANSSAANLDAWAYQQGKSLGKMVLQDILSLVLTTNFGVAIITTLNTNWTKTQILALRKALVDSDANTSQINALVNSVLFTQLLSDANISQAMQFGGSEAIRDAKIPRLYGMDLYESTIVPANGITLYGFAAVPDALLIANRYLDPGPEGRQYYISAMPVTDAETGLTLGYRRHYNPGKGTEFVSFECLYGRSVGITTGLKIATGPN